MSHSCKIAFITVILVGTGCASLPEGPSVMVLPGSGLSFDQFRNDDVFCRQYAYMQVGGTSANQAAVGSGAASAAVGAAVGAAAGAAIGGGEGAAIGAGSGLVAGSLVGTGVADQSMRGTQRHYDVAYIQCMYAKGHQVPVSGSFSNAIGQKPVVKPSARIPPPPAGLPPPPPPK